MHGAPNIQIRAEILLEGIGHRVKPASASTTVRENARSEEFDVRQYK